MSIARSRWCSFSQCLILLRARALAEGEPVATRRVAVLRDDFDDVAIAQTCAQRDHASVHPRACTGLPDLGVDRIGEIYRARVLGQYYHLALGRKGVDLFRIQIDLERGEELVGIGHLPLPLHQRAHPRQTLLILAADRAAVRLVLPVRGNAFLRNAVHLLRADLHLELVPAAAHHGCVQGLIQIRPRHGDEVLDAPRYRPPDGVDQPEDRVAVLHALGDDPDRQQVIDLVNARALFLQLLVDAVKALDAPLYPRVDIVLLQLLLQRPLDLFKEVLALLAALVDSRLHLFKADCVDVAKRKVLKLTAHLAHAQAVRQRSVDVQRLPRNRLLAFHSQVLQGAHVVQTVGQLDEHYAHIAHHGEQHLAYILGLAVFAVRKLDLVNFGDTLDDVRHLLAKELRDIVRCY